MGKFQKKVMIATVYSFEPVIVGAMKTGVDELYLIIDNNPDEDQENAVKEIKKVLEDYVKIHLIKTKVYDLVEITQKCIQIIDKIPQNQRIFLNVSAARKTKSMSLMFSGYARNEKVHQIIYVTKEDKEIIILPKLSFKLSSSERNILVSLSENPNLSSKDIRFKSNLSKSQFYKSMKNLVTKGMVDENKITDAGKIAVL